MTDSALISGVSISHTSASVDDIETVCSLSEREAVEHLAAQQDVKEAFVLQTCNRAEAYVVTEEEARGREVLADYAAAAPDEVARDLDHEESLEQLLRVACGLESLIVGEDQILGQLRSAYDTARTAGAVGPVLDDGLLKALHVGERARTETAINDGVVSLGSAAARLAGTECALANATALVVGAGEMGTLAAQSFTDSAAEVVIANRTRERADHVAETLDGNVSAVGLGALPVAVTEADVIVTATGSSTPVLDGETLLNAGETFIIDIAQPRDVAPSAAGVTGVDVRDLDDLRSLTDATLASRQAAAREVEEIIQTELDHLLAQYKRKRADEVISAMYEGAERMKERELSTALSKLEEDGLTDDQRATIEAMADTLVSQLLAAPTQSLRAAAEEDDWTTIHTALQLFDPTGGAPSQLSDAKPDEIPDAVRQQMPPAVLEKLGATDD
ncbi:glutamyl-tRNA reductase [Halosegnis rubeus]|jgi:glutamyl-tRNA reductase|uniref:Glutamyl-tRNA reductase n=1 Tax=Halosegnis rubeus TaxID=2212850 RepID=A0A5N5UF87_9EURY|nr:glutamyl-tRNA reductase [Halosegnis rubeus]KAB7515655.1 glutamyl-tRNA reductase [Halosegnis rubeus]KAB7517140.1 glutamyl-tRNA reductase [Halosegnis rubeus]KAB7519741.1 glutamyl-tRNA reductase [Halosegnis rubeus]